MLRPIRKIWRRNELREDTDHIKFMNTTGVQFGENHVFCSFPIFPNVVIFSCLCSQYSIAMWGHNYVCLCIPMFMHTCSLC
ncbi:hypothetical protein CDL12_12280 [Handroanthus impetiginosus]|uniref:Uncharacterized protein n=1 Tax=Handroanthus impetiginosus TaxID=429701 RepID=A0A2G9HC32_9LAMI|nr:hypothetical protein CDL12_12280 [Handroanthus impetiginosus]